jgi:hypothetical protein
MILTPRGWGAPALFGNAGARAAQRGTILLDCAVRGGMGIHGPAQLPGDERKECKPGGSAFSEISTNVLNCQGIGRLCAVGQSRAAGEGICLASIGRPPVIALGVVRNVASPSANSRLSSSSRDAVALGPLPKDLGWRLEAASQLQISCPWEYAKGLRQMGPSARNRNCSRMRLIYP